MAEYVQIPSACVAACRYEEAFGKVLDMSDVGRVTWLCQQLDPAQVLNQEPLPLSQSVLLSLMQQLGSQLGKVCPTDALPGALLGCQIVPKGTVCCL